jgi:glycosyltransferase involved in cell wall biosynthesis
MRMLQLSTFDFSGGAERVALALHRAYRRRGHDAHLLVRFKQTRSDQVFEIDPYAHTMPWGPVCAKLEKWVRNIPTFRGQYRLVKWLRLATLPMRWLDNWQGYEDFNYPYSHHLLNVQGWRPDLIHAHNLHDKYFDLRALSHLSQQIPVIWTLHDSWALTGHCTHFSHINCDRWRRGCGDCPDLKNHLAIRRDRSAANWQRKKQIYQASKLAIATPSRWLMEYVEQSMLKPWQQRVIPNGIDLSVFRPDNRKWARQALNLPLDATICMFIAPSGSGPSAHKDFGTVEKAVRQAAAKMPSEDLLLLCVGGDREPFRGDQTHYVGRIADQHRVALYYQASDIMLHGALTETFPLVVIEGLASGTPVVASSVGGIPDLILEGETGFLVPCGDAELMAERLLTLIRNPELCKRMGEYAALYAHQEFGLERQVDSYLEWFAELIKLHDKTQSS